MTDRDQFAMTVLTGLLANPQGWDVTNARAAEYAYAIADAMLKERANHEERAATLSTAADLKGYDE